MIDPLLYDLADPAADQARNHDKNWFAANPRQTWHQADATAADRARQSDVAFFKANPQAKWRVRPILEGESPLVDGLRTRAPRSRAYMFVINHARARDKRAKAELGPYPIFLPDADRETAKRLLTEEAARLARWFKRSAATPPPTPQVAFVAGGAA